MTTELPDAAWFAEHIMEWINIRTIGDVDAQPISMIPHFHDHANHRHVTVIYLDGSGPHRWDPLANDADALNLWRQMPNPKALIWDDEQCMIIAAVGKVSATGSPLPLAICGAIHARWLVHKKEN